jgi:hypothetical protein
MSGFAMKEYSVPKCGMLPRVPSGQLAKDSRDGVTSRLGQIKIQAGKTPGPGYYIKHADWADPIKKCIGNTKSMEPKYSYPKCPRSQGEKMNKVPGPGTYDGTATGQTKPRVLMGKAAKGPKRNFLDNAKAQAAWVPAPGTYDHTKRADVPHMGAPAFELSKKVAGTRKGAEKQAPGPGAYTPGWTQCETKEPNWGTSKSSSMTYVDKVAQSKKNLPAPGKYDLIPIEKITRGTKWTQVHGLGRSALHGTF